MLDDLFDHLVQPVDDVVFLLPERRLVGDLEEIAQRLGAFAIQPAHRQADLVHRLDDLLICSLKTSAGRCTIAEARIPVPTFVGQAVRYPSCG